LAGLSDSAQTVMKVETDLAKASMDRVSRRDPYKTYHRLDRKGVEEDAPHFEWTAFFDAAGVPSVQAINVTVPEFFKEVDRISTGNLDELRSYLRWRVLDSAAPALGKAFVDEDFRMEQALRGAKQLL